MPTETPLSSSEPQTPEWVRDAIFYQIFPDRFARSMTVPKPSGLEAWGTPPTNHGYQGGDLVGVAERLDLPAQGPGGVIGAWSCLISCRGGFQTRPIPWLVTGRV